MRKCNKKNTIEARFSNKKMLYIYLRSKGFKYSHICHNNNIWFVRGDKFEMVMIVESQKGFSVTIS